MDKGKPAIGYQNFEEVRTGNIFYIDKTDFIREWWERADKVTLITRPRRFGKTLNMSMVECFFSNKYADRGELFQGLSIWKEETYRQVQGTYPVIFLSFANVKASTYDKMKYKITELFARLYEQNSYLLDGSILSSNEKKYFRDIQPGMGDEVASGAVNAITEFLYRYYGKNVIIVLDEYDTPMQEAWVSGYWGEAAEFFRGLFNATFKTNAHMERGLITGITRISKESIFSDFNNLKVVTTTSDAYAVSFGFTQEEVFQALEDMELGEEKQGVKKWYNGFTFGSHTDIYNPWSIISFISENGKYKPYWSNTSGNGLVNTLIQQGNTNIKRMMEELLKGDSIETALDEEIAFEHLKDNTNAVWSLLVATGYLKVLHVEAIKANDEQDALYTLSLTNFEVKKMFRSMVKGWFQSVTSTVYNDFIKALLMDDVDSMNEFMNDIALRIFSNFDTAKSASSKDAPERFYHGFVLGLMVELDGRFRLTSNRESGFGRYDVMLTPVDREKDDAYIIEFKVHKPGKEKDLQETLTNALTQIEAKKYAAHLTAEGIEPRRIRKYGFAFQGKACLIGASVN